MSTSAQTPELVSPPPPPIEAATVAAPPDSIDLLEIVAIFVAQWRTGAIAGAVMLALSLLLIHHMPEQYEASAVLLPRDASPSSTGLAALFAGRSSSPYLSLLVSRTLRDEVIRRANLLAYFHVTSEETARNRLFAMTKISPGSDGTMTVQVRDRSAQGAARIANAYLDALRSVQESLAMTQSDIQRHFFEQQLQREKDALAAAEQDLEKTQEGSGIVSVDTQTQIGLSAIAGARSQITSLQVRLAALLQSETDQNPEVQTLRSQIAQLESQERTLESGRGGTGVGAAPAAGRMPGVNLAYARKAREVRYHETLVNSLADHFEQTRLAQANLGDNFDVIDRALVPETPTWPPRRLYSGLALGAAIFAGLFAIAFRLVAERILRDPVQRRHLQAMRRSFLGGR